MTPTAEQNAQQERQPGTPTAEHLWIALARTYRSLSQLTEQSVAAAGLSLSDFMLLEALLHKGPLTITEVQASILLATGSMTAVVDRVERKGLIQRQASEHDRRARVLVLTEAGRALIEQAYQQHRAELRQWFEVLSSSQQRTTFESLRLLERHTGSLLGDDKHG
ncbi:MarR family winged helix-turn-helix transcriptional regulator [Terriglobus tenax]|uniref:MarR family winged helix-turn-helix transcriptional regulator n=1 Tax=Terriglobus tenax TaxID=1111115 RepID=UPI0021E0B4A6|nr:MarR family winged helix-turn-helix transcriptional regulator [Terriglobus tenax]